MENTYTPQIIVLSPEQYQSDIEAAQRIAIEQYQKIQDNNTFLTITQTADILGKRYETILRRVKAGKIKSIRDGQSYLIRKSDLIVG
jgi:excisionase family DNA binding protein